MIDETRFKTFYTQTSRPLLAYLLRVTGEKPLADDVFQESYEDVTKVLKNNPLTAVPPELLMVGRVFGLLNGLSMTLNAKTNMLTAFAQLADQMDQQKHTAAAANGNGAQADAPKARRRLLEA